MFSLHLCYQNSPLKTKQKKHILPDILNLFAELLNLYCTHFLSFALHYPKFVLIMQKYYMNTLIVCQEINSQEQAEIPILVLMSTWLLHTAVSPLQLPHHIINNYLTPSVMPPRLSTKFPNPQLQWFSNSGMLGRFQNHLGFFLK